MQPLEADIFKIFLGGTMTPDPPLPPSPPPLVSKGLSLWPLTSSKAFSLCCLLLQPTCLLLKNINLADECGYWEVSNINKNILLLF